MSASGTVTASQLYGPYGAARYQNGTLPIDYGFTHQRADATSGLDYYGGRYYDPVAGQFSSADTMLAGGLNRYGYVGGNPESATDPSGHVIAPQREYSKSFAMYQVQTQPAKAYVNQWAAPCDWGCTASLVGEAVLGTDTINRSYHVMTDPHASAGDRWKAAGIFTFTIVGDGVTIGSLFFGQAEVGAGVRAADEALLAASDLAKGAEVSTEVATKASPSLLRAGDAGAKLPMSMDTVNSVAQKYGIDLTENDIRINKAVAGVRGSTARNQAITLYRDAFENEAELAKTLVHEQYHVSQLQGGMPYPGNYDAAASWEAEAEAAAQS